MQQVGGGQPPTTGYRAAGGGPGVCYIAIHVCVHNGCVIFSVSNRKAYYRTRSSKCDSSIIILTKKNLYFRNLVRPDL